jgi:Domain of unknown function (DUF4432)
MVSLWGRPWTRRELLARVGRLDQVAGVQLVEAGDGAERGVRLLRFTAGSGFGFDVLVDRGFTWCQLGSGTYVVAMEPSTNQDAGRLDARAPGELQHLAPGEERRYTLEIGALAGTEEVDACVGRIGQLAGLARNPVG